ncbi:MAG: hypothetical protein QOF89_1193 [Acidobacteriota bacterium]|nr:hypothetical protein [Acidobacteriota bacterium]
MRSTELQLVALTSLEQVTVPDGQVTVAVQRAFSSPTAGCLAAAKRTPLGCVAQEPAAGWPRIAARAALVRGAGLGVWAKPAAEAKRRTQATNDNFFIIISSYVVSDI